MLPKLRLLLMTAVIMVCSSINLYSQNLFESFSDGNITASPVWGGNVSEWSFPVNSDVSTGATGSNTLRLNASSGGGSGGTRYLSSQISNWGNGQEWGFWIGRRAQPYTLENQLHIWLYANEADLTSSTVDGYRISIGDNTGNDELRLEYIVNGAVSATVITSSGAINNGLEDIGFLLRVTRSATGVWSLYTSVLPTANGSGAIATDIPDAASTTVSQGTNTNNSLAPSSNGYLGILVIYTSSSAPRAAVEIDQIYFTTCTASSYFYDNDSDGYGDPALSVSACTAPAGYVSNNTDCNDANAAIHPGATEICNGVDDDCDGSIDEGVKTTFYRDADGDGYGNPSVTTQACTVPAGYVSNSTDCNDANAAIHPGATEVCNGVDDNCDGSIDEGVKTTFYRDADSDGYGNPASTTEACTVPAGYVSNSTDCNDANAAIHPGATEICNGVDDNCDGSIDEGVKTTFYRDADGDGYGNPSVTTQACTVPAGYVANSTDCDDTDGAINPNTVWYLDADGDGYYTSSQVSCTSPGAGYTRTVTASGDCAPADNTKWQSALLYIDVDGDNYDAGQTTVCYGASYPSTYKQNTLGTDCNDASAAVHPGATEVCNGVDDNCDGSIDEGVKTTFYRDADGDGYGNPSVTTQACTVPAGYVANADDCDDTDGAINPNTVWYLDADGDGYYTSSQVSCTSPGAGYTRTVTASGDCAPADNTKWQSALLYIDVDGDNYDAGQTTVCYGASYPSTYKQNTLGTDCNDASAAVHPGATEVCNGVDDDCDGSIDEGVKTTFYRDADGDGYGNPSVTTQACTVPAGYVANADDCDDTDGAINPNTVWYLDADGDGYYTSSQVSCTSPGAGYTRTVTAQGDCAPADNNIWQSALLYIDVDGDNYDAGQTTVCYGASYASIYKQNTLGNDCNDNSAAVHPGATEVCNGVDDDCDGSIDEGVKTTFYRDADSDGYGNPSSTTEACVQPTGYVTNNTDCNDGSAAVHPGATEVCNGVDDDCDGFIDEGVKTTFYRDLDGDGYGNPSVTTQACTVPAGYVTNSTDCDDNNSALNPSTIWYLDADGDGFAASTTVGCNHPGAGYTLTILPVNDCNDNLVTYQDLDGDGFGTLVKVPCNGVVNSTDCDDTDDEINPNTVWYLDADGDGYYTSSQVSCTSPGAGYTRTVTASGDCAPADNTKWQSALLYIDVDGDNYDAGQTTVCYGASYPSMYKQNTLGSDCNDNNAAVNPAATEICNGIDDDCDGTIDDGFINTQVNCAQTGTVTKNLLSGCTYTVAGTEFDATAIQNCGPLGYTLSGATTGTGTLLAGVQFNSGTTTVTWSATNAGGQVISCSFDVYVVPSVPVITCPSNVSVNADQGQCGAVVNYTAPSLPALCTNNSNLSAATQTFNYTGTMQTWIVPAGVTKVKIKSWGAQGGGSMSCITNPVSYTDDGGLGGFAQGELNVTPGQTLNIFVGGKPITTAAFPLNYATFTDAGGYNGGGTAGYYGGGGGGASDVRVNGTALANRVIVAGGGGGGNTGCGDHGAGGAGGGLNGAQGINYVLSWPGGGGGTQLAGGAAGSGYTQAQAGTLGLGGNATPNNAYHIAGGGGGYYGGGSGSAAGGGGGSSYIAGLLNASTIAGVQSGHGKIEFEWEAQVEPSVTQTAGLPSGAEFPVGTTTNTFLITDAFGQTSTCSFEVTVTDNQAPTIVQPQDIVVSNTTGECTKSVSYAGASASDNCGVTSLKYFLNYTLPTPVEITFPRTFAVGSYLITVEAKDAANHVTTKTFTVTVNDTELPEVSAISGISSCFYDVNSAKAAAIAAVQYSDNCTPNNLLTVTAAVQGSCSALVTVYVTDGSGNTNSVSFNTKIDNTAPVFTGLPSSTTLTVSCHEVPNAPTVTANDNCDGARSVTYTPSSTKGSDPSQPDFYNYTITRKWEVWDGCNNYNSFTQTITVQDVSAPVITCPDNFLNVPFDFGQLYATINKGLATATDNCAPVANIAITNNDAIMDQHYPSGSTSIIWKAKDPSNKESSCTQTITVRKRNTLLTYTGSQADNKICVQYSDTIQLSALLTDDEGLTVPNVISGRTVVFQLLDGTTVLRSKTGTTDVDGIIRDTFKIDEAPGINYSVKTIFAGDDYFNGDTDQDALHVKQENALLAYVGSQYFTTPSATNYSADVIFTSSVTDSTDGNLQKGDIRNARVNFRSGSGFSTSTIIPGASNIPVGLVYPGTTNLQEGLASFTYNYTLVGNEQNSSGKTWEIWTEVNNYYKGQSDQVTLVTLALPGTDNISGGGNLVITNSAGMYAATAQSKMNFGFTMRWNKSGKNLQGQINIIFRRWELFQGVMQWRTYQIKSNAINSMSVQPDGGYSKGTINTKATLNDITDPLNVINYGGNHALMMRAWDHTTTTGGSMDQIAVSLINSSNNLLFASSWSSNALQIQTITGGNINVKNNNSANTTAPPASSKSVTLPVTEKVAPELKLEMQAHPNPANSYFNVSIQTTNKEARMMLRVTDINGRVIETRGGLYGDQSLQIGQLYMSGVYIVEVVQGDKKAQLKLVKL